jgi:hypothetical protein
MLDLRYRENIFEYFWFPWPPVNLSNTYLQVLRGRVTISYGMDFFVP